jgi:[acyl-carrier-protein] S-malonyltransferase
MPEYHPGTDVEVQDGVATSGFRNKIANVKRYQRHNNVNIEQVAEVAYVGDYDRLEELLATGDEKNLFNGDLNLHVPNMTCLHLAAKAGQTECVELLLRAGADPHIKERMAYGDDPEDGKTAREVVDELGFDDIVDILKDAEKNSPYGWYVPEGPTNNEKMYGGWEHKTKPEKGWYSSRPGVAQRNGYDPRKYGGAAPRAPKIFEDLPDEDVAAKPKAAISAGPPPLPIGLLFPGQGSQYVKMMSGVKDIPKVKEMLDKANQIIGVNLLDMCLRGPEATLEETRYCQPAMFVAGLAGVEKLRVEKPDAVNRCKALAGLSLGEYTALCVAGVFTFEEGLKLVALRGQAMQDAATVGKQAMLSCAGIEKGKLNELCREAAAKEGGNAVCVIANELFPKGYSCSGTEPAINHLKDLAEKNGALQAKILKTSGAFHTTLMTPAKTKLGQALDEALPNMKPPRTAVYMNVSGNAVPPGTDPKEIVELLKRQLVSPVLWEPSVRNMIRDGVTEFYECGPMKQIKAMMKRIDPKIWGTTTNIDV